MSEDDKLLAGFRKMKERLALADTEFPGKAPEIVALCNLMAKDTNTEWNECFAFLVDVHTGVEDNPAARAGLERALAR